MELTKKFNVPRVRGLPSSRRGAVALAVGCALAAGIILLIALSHIKQSVTAANKQVSVLVSTASIQKGTAGDLIAAQQLYKLTPILNKNLSTGALTNAAALRGEVAVQNILPGQQLTAADFDPLFIESAMEAMDERWPFTAKVHDMLAGPLEGNFDGGRAA